MTPRRLASIARKMIRARNVIVEPVKMARLIADRLPPLEPIEFRFGPRRFRARGLDWFGIHEVLIDGEYSPLGDTLDGAARPIVYDLGANVGCFAMYATEGPSTDRRVSADGDETVPTVTLESLFARFGHDRADLVKMDIEGAERAALPSAAGLLDRVGMLVIEIHADDIVESCTAILRRAFPYLYRMTGRTFGKPLVVACRERQRGLSSFP